MSNLHVFGVKIFEDSSGQTLLNGITSSITDNAGIVLTVMAGVIGISVAVSMINGARKGKLRVRP